MRRLRLMRCGRVFLLDRFGYLPHRLVSGGSNLAQDLHRHANHFGHALGTEHDQRHREDNNDLE